MTVIFNQRQEASSFGEWYQKNRERISEQRKKLYAENPEYRERKLAASKQYRETGSSAQPTPSGCFSLEETAEEVGIAVATLRDWRRKKLFPEPLYQKGCLWFRPHQVLLLKQIREFFRKWQEVREVQATKAAGIDDVCDFRMGIGAQAALSITGTRLQQW